MVLAVDDRALWPLTAGHVVRMVDARRLVRHTGPAGGRYAQRDELAPPATLRPDTVDVVPLALGELFRGL